MRKRVTALSLLVLGSLTVVAVACSKGVELKMAVQVVSDPEQAQVQFKGKDVGQTPIPLSIKTFDELTSIVARKEGLEVQEKRIRIESPDRATVIFRMAKDGVSPVAKALGLTKVLIFDYSEKVSFDSAKADLKEDGLAVLNKQADILKLYFPNATINVCGYTDSTGSDDFNMKLSLKRAQAVADYLAARGVAGTHLKTHGFGKDYPADTNATPAGRALNRRTEVILPQ